MRGLDTRGFMDGALKGFSVADGYYDRQHQQGLRENQDERAQGHFEMAEERHDLSMSEAQRKREQEMAQFTLGKLAQGMDLSDDEFQFLKQNPKYWPALDPETDKSIEVAQSIIDPDSPVGPNDPESVAAMNQLWSHRINRGEGGKKRIAGLYPGQSPGTVAIDLEVEGEDGSKRNAPMTKNRGVEGDDEVLETPVEAMVNQVQGYRILRNAFRSPAAQAHASKILAALTGKTTDTKPVVVNNKLVDPKSGAVIGDYGDPNDGVKGVNINGYLVDPRTGEQIGDFRTADQKAGRGAGKAPADVQTAEWMVQNGIARDLSEAWEKTKMATTNPAMYVSKYVDQELKVQEAAGLGPGAEGYRNTEQLRKEAVDSLRYVRSQILGEQAGEPDPDPDPGTETPPPKGLQITGKETQVMYPEDGSAIKREDGSYAGQVFRDGQQPRSAGLNPQPRPASNPANLRPFKPGERVENPDGSYSTERTITVEVDGKYMNIPTLWMAPSGPQQMSDDEAVKAAIHHMKKTGQKFPSFSSVEQAVTAAKQKSQAGGAGGPNPATHAAPPEAVKYLQQNPQFAADFKAKYGYLPEGF